MSKFRTGPKGVSVLVGVCSFFMGAAYNPGVLKYLCSKALKDGCLEFLGSNLGQYPLSLRLQLSRHTTVWDPPFHRLVSTSALSCTYTDKLDGRMCPRHLGRYHNSEYPCCRFRPVFRNWLMVFAKTENELGWAGAEDGLDTTLGQ